MGATKLGGPGSQRWTFTATGAVTNVAARLAGISSGGDIVVGPVTAERIRLEFVLEALGEQTLKNVSELVRVYRLIPPGVYDKVVWGARAPFAGFRDGRARAPTGNNPTGPVVYNP